MNNISLWIVTSFLALALVRSAHRRLDGVPGEGPSSGMDSRALAPGTARTVGMLQLVTAFGLIVPGLLRTATVLVPLSACAVIALLFWTTDFRETGNDRRRLLGAALTLAAAAFVASGRFGTWAL